MSESSKKYRAEDIVAALRKKFNGNDVIALEQVRNSTGFVNNPQTIDFAVINLWPSKGLIRSAFEVKVSRQDFLREVQNPNKNSDFKECFHEFWYATAPGVVADIREIPDNCGWLELRGERFVTKLIAKTSKTATLDDALLASICRSARKEQISDDTAYRKKVIAECPELKELAELRMFKAAVKKFAQSRGKMLAQSSEDEIIQSLQACLVDPSYQKILRAYNTLQNDLLDAWRTMTVITAVTLDDVEKSGRDIVNQYGSNSVEFGIAKQRLLAKDNPIIADALLELVEHILPGKIALPAIQKRKQAE